MGLIRCFWRSLFIVSKAYTSTWLVNKSGRFFVRLLLYSDLFNTHYSDYMFRIHARLTPDLISRVPLLFELTQPSWKHATYYSIGASFFLFLSCSWRRLDVLLNITPHNLTKYINDSRLASCFCHFNSKYLLIYWKKTIGSNYVIYLV